MVQKHKDMVRAGVSAGRLTISLHKDVWTQLGRHTRCVLSGTMGRLLIVRMGNDDGDGRFIEPSGNRYRARFRCRKFDVPDYVPMGPKEYDASRGELVVRL